MPAAKAKKLATPKKKAPESKQLKGVVKKGNKNQKSVVPNDAPEVTHAEEVALVKKLFGGGIHLDSSSDEEEEDVMETCEVVGEQKAVWRDEDDDVNEDVELPSSKKSVFLKKSTDVNNVVSKQDYQRRLRAAFERTFNAGKVPSWAKKSKAKKTEVDEDSDDEVANALEEMTRSTGKYMDKNILLPRGAINLRKVPDILIGHADPKPVRVVRFHKTKPVLVTAGDSGCIKLFQVDMEAKKDHFLQSAEFPKFNITSMDFMAGGNILICGSTRQEYFIKYDLTAGTFTRATLPKSIPKQSVGKFAVSSSGTYLALAGYSQQVHLLTTSSMEHIKSVSVSANIVSLCFLPGSDSEVWIMTENGEVNIWNSRNCSLHSFIDHGTVKGTSISMSQNGAFVACGSNTGVVNIYEPDDVRKTREPKPLASLETLLTSCDGVAFNHDNQTVVAISAVKKNQYRMLHLRSGTMFADLPPRHDKPIQTTCVSFSPHSAYMALGSYNGHVRLYRLGHFEDY